MAAGRWNRPAPQLHRILRGNNFRRIAWHGGQHRYGDRQKLRAGRAEVRPAGAGGFLGGVVRAVQDDRPDARSHCPRLHRQAAGRQGERGREHGHRGGVRRPRHPHPVAHQERPGERPDRRQLPPRPHRARAAKTPRLGSLPSACPSSPPRLSWAGCDCGPACLLRDSARQLLPSWRFGGAVRGREARAMSTVVVVGAQWGDEGKGKVVDYLAAGFDLIARYQGGHNAGHTVVVDGRKFILQLTPSGILRPGKQAVIGAGVVLDPAALLDKMAALEKNGVQVAGRLFISNRAHLIFPYHRELEKAAEAALGALKIGTTARGIGPTYEDKMGRRGLRTCDLLDPQRFEKKLARLLELKAALARALYGKADMDSSRWVEQYQQYAERLRPFITDVAVLLAEARRAGKSTLCEGAQGTMLDIDHGTYP